MESEIQEKICEIIFYFIHAAPRLKYLFLRWCRLSSEDKYNLDEDVLHGLSLNGKHIYPSLREAFIQWDILQDTQGAPGFQPDCHDYKCNEYVEEEIIKVINALEVSLDNLYYKNDLDTQEEKIFEWTKVNVLKNVWNSKLKRCKSLNDLHNTTTHIKKGFSHVKSKNLSKSKSDIIASVPQKENIFNID